MRFRKLLSLILVSSMALSQPAFPNAHSVEVKAQETQKSAYSMRQEKSSPTTPTPSPVTTQIPTVTESNITPTSAFSAILGSSGTAYMIPVTPTNYHPYTSVNRLHFRWHDFCYNAAESATLIIDGNFNGLDKIYYKGRKLTQNVDYRKELHYLT